MKPCDCKSINDTIRYLNEAGISFNENSLIVLPCRVELTIGRTTTKIPMHLFRLFAEWYLEDQQKWRKDE